MLNQKYFNGIGNYLRAEILFRAGVRPFERSRDVLQPLADGIKVEHDLLDLCKTVMTEVQNLSENFVGGGGYVLPGADSSGGVSCTRVKPV